MLNHNIQCVCKKVVVLRNVRDKLHITVNRIVAEGYGSVGMSKPKRDPSNKAFRRRVLLVQPYDWRCQRMRLASASDNWTCGVNPVHTYMQRDM
jgi:hypothetical protein